VLVLPQWNSDAGGHVGLCRLLARFGVTAIRLSLPYHDARKPADLARADFIVSANVGRTVQINRQAVLDARRVIDWLEGQGYERIGILGTSLGSCLSMLTMAHDTRIRAGVFVGGRRVRAIERVGVGHRRARPGEQARQCVVVRIPRRSIGAAVEAEPLEAPFERTDDAVGVDRSEPLFPAVERACDHVPASALSSSDR
jgi:hypothetical protein